MSHEEEHLLSSAQTQNEMTKDSSALKQPENDTGCFSLLDNSKVENGYMDIIEYL